MGDALTKAGHAPQGRNWMHVGGGYTTVDNTIFRERALSARAKGIYCQIRSAESNPSWQFTIPGIAACVADSEYATRKALKELERAGFLLRAQRRHGDGTFASAADNVWITLDDPSLFKAAAKRAAAEGLNIISARTRREGHSHERAAAADSPTPAHPEAALAAAAEPCESMAQADLPAIGPEAASGCAGTGERGQESAAQLGDHRPVPGAAIEAAAKADRCLERLKSLSLKPVSPRSQPAVQAAWDEAIGSGTDPEAIVAAYAAYVEAYEESNGSNLRYAKRLERWLTDGDGMAHWLRRTERARSAEREAEGHLSDAEMRALRASSPETQQDALARIDPIYRVLREEMDALKGERPSGWLDRADELMWQAHARFCRSSKEIAKALMREQAPACAIG